VGGASYFLDPTTAFFLYTDPRGNLYDPWRAEHRGVRFQTEATTQLGYNTIRYHYATGPLEGTSALLEATAGIQPFHDEYFGNLRLDVERYFSLFGRTNFALRAGAGTTIGGRFARSYYLSSFDTLRGVNFGDEPWLLGRNFFFSTAELQIPLNDIIRVAFLSDLEGVIGLDFGGVGNTARGLWDRRVLDFAIGGNILLGPLLLRLHFARPIGIGAAAGKPDDGWVTNFSIGIAGLNAFFDQRGERPVGYQPSLPTGFGYTSPRGPGGM
jgi:outer membrane protein assembly factor BamA